MVLPCPRSFHHLIPQSSQERESETLVYDREYPPVNPGGKSRVIDVVYHWATIGPALFDRRRSRPKLKYIPASPPKLVVPKGPKILPPPGRGIFGSVVNPLPMRPRPINSIHFMRSLRGHFLHFPSLPWLTGLPTSSREPSLNGFVVLLDVLSA
ncbi:uncharacterized protein BO66DRAFT_259887 [Aspergillus aculeatinus CBS 121060]|uniref:Uncharacterized protein n=1 Tax=Aspergillus aculeatinus CBS 121060 TaxID=1448322 RepID=A0ACD1GQZ2_9EURO|nr:hypothetical protein BO66DRAFT_259887 [Aspergillus aculeatinus CBS 121060]RAH63835.1 hypothetical protein BO66DRAFT_259887 [Aspergillus aculeatinus CBS 121060]